MGTSFNLGEVKRKGGGGRGKEGGAKVSCQELRAKTLSRSVREDEYQRISKPQLPPVSLGLPSPALFCLLCTATVNHSPIPPFLPVHISNCLQQTVWHLTEFHLKPENFCWKGSGSHRGFPPTQARILTQDLCKLPYIQLQRIPPCTRPFWITSSQWAGRGRLHPPAARSLGGSSLQRTTKGTGRLAANPKGTLSQERFSWFAYLGQPQFRGTGI